VKFCAAVLVAARRSSRFALRTFPPKPPLARRFFRRISVGSYFAVCELVRQFVFAHQWCEKFAFPFVDKWIKWYNMQRFSERRSGSK
jgi:hypothetical protein